MSQKEVNFITLHEDFHLLFNHPRRTITGQYNHKLSNIAQDMIINHIIWEDISHNFVEIPKDKTGKNMALFVPKEYTGKLIFEELYEWLKEKKDEHQKAKKQECSTCSSKKDSKDGQTPQKGQGQDQKQDKGQKGDSGDGGSDSNDQCPECGGKDSKGNPSYGPYGKNPGKDGQTIDTWSLDQILDDLENGTGEYLDKHIGDDVPEEMREAMVRDVMDRLQARGLSSGNIESTLNKLRKQRKDYLKEIKRTMSNLIFGTIKNPSIVKLNRRGIPGLKGNKKLKTKINVILDCSGSMGGQGDFERVLSYVYQNDIEMNFIQADTEVKWVENFKKKRQLETMKIHGLGGTQLQPALDYVVQNYNQFNTVMLTDGYCDTLDFSKVKGRVLLITIGTAVPIKKSNGKVKQITVDKTS
jgi:predicted metal-dependent peptidase